MNNVYLTPVELLFIYDECILIDLYKVQAISNPMRDLIILN
jgi:hypothetical protein